MQWSSDERQRFIGVLDGIERAVVLAYRLLLVLIIMAVVVFAAFVVVRQPWGAGAQGEWFYFGVAILLVLGWAVGQFLSLGRRDAAPDAVFRVLSNHEPAGVHTWKLQLGSPSTDDGERSSPTADVSQSIFSRGFEIPLATVMHEMLPDDAMIGCIEAEMDRGASLEWACRQVQPQYDAWSSMQQRAFMLYVSRVLEQRSRANDSAEA